MLLHKHVGRDYDKVDQELLAMLQDSTSLFQPYMWPERKRNTKGTT
jgi:hypothetical protein